MVHNKKKILYLHHGGGQGGAPQSLIYLIKKLDREKYEPIIACGYDEPHAKEFFESQGFSPINIPVARFAHCFPSGYYSLYKPRHIRNFFRWYIKQNKSKKAFKKKLKEINPDIVHLNSLTIAPLARVAKEFGYKVVLHVREAAIKLHAWDIRWYWLRWLANNYADRVIYICEDNQKKLTGKTEHSTVIYNPIPFDKFDKEIDGYEIRRNLNIPIEAIVLFFPGGSSHHPKGIDTFLKTLKKLKDGNNDVVAIVPKINDRKEIIDSINKLNLENSIIKLPFTENVENYFAVSDIVVTPFIVPHFSRAVIEAGAMAKPVVGSRIGGIEEVVDDGVTGLLFKAGKSDDLRLQLLKLIKNKRLRNKIGNAGYKKAVKRYADEIYSIKVMDIYEDI